MAKKEQFDTTVTHSLVDEDGKVWVESTTCWKNSSYAEAVALQSLLVNALNQTVKLGWSIVDQSGDEEGKKLKEMTRKVMQDDDDDAD